ncbi:MAG: hypothetical protein JWQ02_983 [Capsulimonas sp.]|nr:hypothetical protein [Capsulimonas sp.]
MLRTVDNENFKPGQVWKYHTRPYEDGSTLTIVRTEHDDRLGSIIHIHVDEVRVKAPMHKTGLITEIGHLPCAEEVISQSVTEVVRENAPLRDFMEGYQQWRDAFDAGKAGIWTVPVAEMVSALESIVNSQQADE